MLALLLSLNAQNSVVQMLPADPYVDRVTIVFLTKVNGYIMREKTNICLPCSTERAEVKGSGICQQVALWTFREADFQRCFISVGLTLFFFPIVLDL